MTRPTTDSDLEHLEYHLHLLFGASRIEKSFNNPNQPNIGYLIWYFRNSAFVHARSLYYFFTGTDERDLNVSDFISYNFSFPNLEIWLDAINKYEVHIDKNRDQKLNKINGVAIEDMVVEFATEIETAMNAWVANESDPTEQSKIQKTLDKAIRDGENDCINFIKLIEKESDEQN